MAYSCIVFSQRTDENSPEFCLFEAPVKDVISWSTIPTLTPENNDGIQRPLKDNKVKAIKQFLESDSRNTIPTAIVITISRDACTIENSQITIKPEEKNNILVIDGQHRLCGLNAFNEKTRVPIVAILDASHEERAFQFIIINNKVTKVAPDHIRALTLRLTREEDKVDLENRLKTSRLSLSPNLSYVGLANDLDDSPFKGIISLPNMPEDDRKVVPAAIEASIAYIQSKNIKEFSGEDAAYDFFITIWDTIKNFWPNTFPNERKLVSKVGIVCLTRYITDAINLLSGYPGNSIDIADSESVSATVKNILKTQTEEFWQAEWNLQIADNRTVRDAIQDALTTIHQNTRYNNPWFNDIPFIKSLK
ncbi:MULTISPECIES: DGQHR domain-containing protein [unclassified Pseudomonas]|uniref:DGQHR domain-containing protein n=1 Tax=unclassified Pseudomonas TaxID=196821 RepID=UPI000CD306A4|nr:MULTISPECIES: DGQHR domain-containing protein [unclassified Pseudomonas]POA57761.1 hypothetical protein C1889_06095 [Pseudomonas sp. FW507-12TSA]